MTYAMPRDLKDKIIEKCRPMARPSSGRLDYVDGRSTAELVYRSKQHIINVLQHPASVSEYSEPHLKVVRGFQIFSWTKEGMSYWAVSDVNAADLQKFVYLWL